MHNPERTRAYDVAEYKKGLGEGGICAIYIQYSIGHL
jgi:hypothetical protein